MQNGEVANAAVTPVKADIQAAEAEVVADNVAADENGKENQVINECCL